MSWKLSGSVERRFAVDELVAGLEEEFDALTGADFEVVLALGADVEIGLDVGLEEGVSGSRDT